MSDFRYPLAPNGVFRTLQGEGSLCGLPMVFVRLAGCSVGCSDAGGAGCDTDYSVSLRLTPGELLERVSRNRYGSCDWAWITGGEPTDHDLDPLVQGLRRMGLMVAVATAGTRPLIPAAFDFVSVSPHRPDHSWVLRQGDQLNVVPGLNGLRLDDLGGLDLSGFPPSRRYVTPLADREGRPVNLQACVDFVMGPRGRGWRLGAQGHKLWGMP